MLTLIFAVGIAMAVSFACSVMEAALLSLNPGKLAVIEKRHPRIGAICAEFKRDIERPIAVILILNTTAHTFGASIAGAQFNKLFGSEYIWLFSLVFTILMVQYTEILPKTLGCRFNTFVMSSTAILLKYSVSIMKPMIWLVHFVNRPFEGKSAEKDVSNSEVLEELDALAVAACNEEHITPVQEQIIRQIPGLKDDTVSDIMVSPEEMVCIHSEMTRDEVLQVMKNSPHSRYPVRDGKTGNRFGGVLTIRQMLVQNTDWMHLIWKVTVVHPQCTLLEIAENLDQYDSKLLLVGGDPDHIIGMLTTNDLISSLFRPNEEEKEEEAPLQ